MPEVTLHAYLGIRNGKPELCVSTSPLNPVGTRLEKGKQFPAVVRDFYRNESLALDALRALSEYFDELNQPKKKRK